MQILQERILKEGKHLGGGILKVDAFMNHQIDPALMQSIGSEFARRFQALQPTKILTAETSGIAPALAAGMSLGIPIVFARKHQPKTMTKNPFRETTNSYTQGRTVELFVSPEYLQSSDRVLILDDFLATANTILALEKLVSRSGATLVGIGTVIEKAFEQGRVALTRLGVPVESLTVIEKLEGNQILFAP